MSFPIVIREVRSARETREKIETSLRSHDYERLGTGAFATAYSKRGADHVVKVAYGFECGADWGYMTYLEEIQKAGPNPFFPKIHSVVAFVDNWEGLTIRVRMERLCGLWAAVDAADPAPADRWRTIAERSARERLVETFGEARRDLSTAIRKLTGDTRYRREPAAPWIAKDLNALALVKTVASASKKSKRWPDLHEGNWLYRPAVKGKRHLEMVLTDPLAYA